MADHAARFDVEHFITEMAAVVERRFLEFELEGSGVKPRPGAKVASRFLP